MRQLAVLLAVLATLASAHFLYATVIETRQLAGRVASLERQLERAEADVAMLRAERARLARPDRIEDLARGLGLVPLAGAARVAPAGGPTR